MQKGDTIYRVRDYSVDEDSEWVCECINLSEYKNHEIIDSRLVTEDDTCNKCENSINLDQEDTND